jgi:hypothetical protein
VCLSYWLLESEISYRGGLAYLYGHRARNYISFLFILLRSCRGGGSAEGSSKFTGVWELSRTVAAASVILVMLLPLGVIDGVVSFPPLTDCRGEVIPFETSGDGSGIDVMFVE